MTTDAERREATDQWTIDLREKQLRELREQLATVTADRDGLALELSHLRPEWQAVTAERDTLATETTEQAWEIAKLRYYIEALERLTTPEERQTAADEASIALAQHNPPASGRHRDRDGMVSATIGEETEDDYR